MRRFRISGEVRMGSAEARGSAVVIQGGYLTY
jgi:hypothetical protein